MEEELTDDIQVASLTKSELMMMLWMASFDNYGFEVHAKALGCDVKKITAEAKKEGAEKWKAVLEERKKMEDKKVDKEAVVK